MMKNFLRGKMMSVDYLTDKQKTILENFTRYRSPVHEVSLFKGIDIQYLKLFKKEFRGDAQTFAIYNRENPYSHRYGS